MGGHGGLNILPQKSWNVYNIKNQNIVRRDEERFRQEQAEAERQAQREQAEARLSKLREKNASTIERFNLFEEEQKNANEYERKRRQSEIEKKEKDKDTWYLSKAKPSQQWYERPTKLDDNGPEIRRRSEQDPMSLVNSLLSQPQSPIRSQHTDKSSKKEKKGHKHRKHKKDKHNEVDAEKTGRRHRKHDSEKAEKRKRHRSPSSATAKESMRDKKSKS